MAGGTMRNNGRWTATEEIVEMGGGEIFKIIDRACIHQNLDFPGQMHSSIIFTFSGASYFKRMQELGLYLVYKDKIKKKIKKLGLKGVLINHKFKEDRHGRHAKFH